MDIRRRLVATTKITTWCCLITALLGLSNLILSSSASAVVTVPTKMNFQGRLTNSAGTTMPDGLYNMKFRLFTVSSGGSAAWEEVRETTNRVQVTNGLFSVQLGSVTAMPSQLFQSGPLYLEVELPSPATATCTTAACGSYTEGPMTPRNQMATSAYSFNAEQLDGLDSSAFAQYDTNGVFSGFNEFLGGVYFYDTVETDQGLTSWDDVRISQASVSALQVQNGGTDVLTVDTTNRVTTLTNSVNGVALKLVGGSTDATNVAVMGVYNSAGTRVGYLGDGYTGSTSMYLQADTGNSINMGINGATSLNLDSSGHVQIGTQNGSMSGHALVVANTSATPMAVRRNSQDGNLISFYRDATLQGSISVAGATVTYNAFTGSHYGWLDGPAPERGALMAMTGDNQYVGKEGESEIVYGMTPTTTPNDPAVLGSYLALSDTSKPYDRQTNQHQVMSVGNGEMWVAETDAGDINPGDELISSAIRGHAMKDKGEYLMSNVVARASERVNWSQVSTTINGVKHTRITVLFGAYTKNNVGQASGVSGASVNSGGVARLQTLILDGHFIGNGDTRGRLKIPAGQTSATYNFKEVFSKKPFVVASPEDRFVPYYVDTSLNSLTIHLDKPVADDQWFSFMVQE